MTGFPQYAKSTAPEVIEACEAMLESYRRFTDYAIEVSKELTGEENRSVYNGSQVRGAQVVGLVVDSKDDYDQLPGQWRKWEGPGFQYPFKNNPIMKGWRENQHKRPSIPERPSIASGNGWMGHGAVFVHEGVAYSGFDFQPDHGGETNFWEEIKASEWHAAKEAYEESQKAEKS